MIYRTPGQTFYPELEGATTGLVGTVGIRILKNSDGSTVTARTTAGITEVPASSGHYVATLTAPTTAGEFTVLWDLGSISPTTTFTEELEVTYSLPVASPSNYEPSLLDVGAISRTRTKNRAGDYLGTFTGDTRPTGTEVTRLIGESLSVVASRVGAILATENVPAARSLVALRTAMFVELSYFPEDVKEGAGPYEQYQQLFESGLKGLLDVLEEDAPGILESRPRFLTPGVS